MKMKLKFAMIVALIWTAQHTFGQDRATEDNILAVVDNYTTEQTEYNQEITTKDTDETKTNNKEWRKIKREIKRNRKKITDRKNNLQPYKMMDTIYLEIPVSRTATQLTNW